MPSVDYPEHSACAHVLTQRYSPAALYWAIFRESEAPPPGTADCYFAWHLAPTFAENPEDTEVPRRVCDVVGCDATCLFNLPVCREHGGLIHYQFWRNYNAAMQRLVPGLIFRDHREVAFNALRSIGVQI